MRQRLHVARVLGSPSPVVVLDEPTLGIDVADRPMVRQAIRELVSSSKTTLVASNDMDDVVQTADYVLALAGGCVVQPLRSVQSVCDSDLVAVEVLATEKLRGLSSDGMVFLESTASVGGYTLTTVLARRELSSTLSAQLQVRAHVVRVYCREARPAELLAHFAAAALNGPVVQSGGS